MGSWVIWLKYGDGEICQKMKLIKITLYRRWVEENEYSNECMERLKLYSS